MKQYYRRSPHRRQRHATEEDAFQLAHQLLYRRLHILECELSGFLPRESRRLVLHEN